MFFACCLFVFCILPCVCVCVRGIFYVNVSHVFLTAIKSKMRASTQADMFKFMTNLRFGCLRMLLLCWTPVETNCLETTQCYIHRMICGHKETTTGSSSTSKLYEPNPPTRDLTIAMSHAFGAVMVEQVDHNTW